MPTTSSGGYSEAIETARFMGLPNWRNLNDIRLVERVEHGLPIKAVDTIVRRIDPKGIHLKAYDLIPKATYYRRKEKGLPLSKNESEKVFSLSKVFAETMRLYQNETRLVTIFLLRKHPMLGGRTPLDVARESTAGADLVLNLLARAEAGIAV